MKSIIEYAGKIIFFIKIIYETTVYIFKKIKILKNINEYKVLISSPSSGSTFVRLVLSSYLEINNNYGNGIPKYNSYLNKDIFSHNSIIMGNYKNEFSLDKLGKENLNDLKNSEKLIFFSRYPLGNRDNIFNLTKSKIVVLLRDPYNEVLSSAVKKVKNINNEKHIMDILNKKISDYEKYISFWRHNLKEKQIKIIKFDEINDKPEKSLKKILEFFNLPVNIELIKNCINIHSVETTLNRMNNINKPNYNRFSNKQIRMKKKENY